MNIKSVSLKQMRNYDELYVTLNKGVNVIYGANAQGKTNFLESIYFCATGRSPRTNADKDLIQFGKTETHIQVFIEKSKRIDRIDAHIKKDLGKGIAVNGIPVKKLSELFGILLTVIFSPEDLMIVKAGPAERRKFIDMELCQLSAVYYYELQQYYKVLKQRNALLKKIQKSKDLKQTVFVWDEQLFEHGKRVIEYRTEFIAKLNEISKKIHYELTKKKEVLEIMYKPNVNSAGFMDKLIRNIERDIIMGSTSVGIHKDEIMFLINEYDVRIFGSQGQQRTASLSAKLAEIALIQEEKGETPVLLLDDVFSELDKTRRFQLVERIMNIQTILTCAGEENAVNNFLESGYANIHCYEVKNGKIRAEN